MHLFVWIELFYEETRHIFSINGTSALQPEPVIDTLGVEDMIAIRQHFDLTASYVTFHTNAALWMLLDLLLDLIFLQSKYLIEEEKGLKAA